MPYCIWCTVAVESYTLYKVIVENRVRYTLIVAAMHFVEDFEGYDDLM